VPPAQLALALILQAYTGVSDDEVIEATVMDRRWQLVLDCLDQPVAPFAKGTLVAFRARLIEANLDRRLIERTVAIAEASKGFGPRALRAALDSSPLWGAGRVEDTYNLMGHALRKALGVIARQQGRGLTEVAERAGAPMLARSSLKAALDLDWDDPAARDHALAVVLAALDGVERFVAAQPEAPAAAEAVGVARRVREQDVELGAAVPHLRRGVARDRRISIEDADMRHGRKSRSTLVDGYKRHILSDLDTDLVVAVGITPANAPEAEVTDAIAADLAAQHARQRRAAHRPGLPVLGPGPRPRRGADHLLQGLAGGQHHRPLRQDRVPHRLHPRTADLPEQRDDPAAGGQDRAVPLPGLPDLSAAGAVHQQQDRSQREHPSRRAAAGRTPATPADPGGTSRAAPTHHRRARPGPHRPLARPPSPIPRPTQEPVRPTPQRRGPQPPRHRPQQHTRSPGRRLTTRPAL
jgi:hypothetical protein